MKAHLSAPTSSLPFARTFSLSGGGPGSGGRGFWRLLQLLLLLLLTEALLRFEGGREGHGHPLHLLTLHGKGSRKGRREGRPAV